MQFIESVRDLPRLADSLGVRADWHEPDKQEVSARVEGDHLDNACGARGVAGERVVVISKGGEDIAQVNLATLLAWGTALGRHVNGEPVRWGDYLFD